MKTTATKQLQTETLQPKANKQAGAQQILQRYKQQTAQLQAAEEEELLQGKFETAQRMELDEEEPIQGKFEIAQRMELDEEEPVQGKFETVRRMELDEEEPVQGKFATTQLAAEEQAMLAKPNNTGLPDKLKSGIENMSGYSMDDVKVHYNSSKPATLQAHAYAQGTDIHIAPGQEKYLPHEAWHVVQQKQGRVKPTMQMKGTVPVNDDAGLEKEADVMGDKAMQMKSVELNNFSRSNFINDNKNTIQEKGFYTFQMKENHQVIQLAKGKLERMRNKKKASDIEKDQAIDPNGGKMKNGLDASYVNEKLEASEANGGHARARHVANDQAYLQGRNITLATTFETKEDQNNALLQVVKINKTKISDWISDGYSAMRLTIQGEVYGVSVRGERRQTQFVEASDGYKYQNPNIPRYVTVNKDVLTNVTVVLERKIEKVKKGETGKMTYDVLTCYPSR